VFPFIFSEDWLVIAVFLVFGTLWWLSIGYLGWRGANERVGQPLGWISGILILLLSVLGILFSLGMLILDIQERRLEVVLVIQEFLIALLCSGALASSLYCLRGAAGIDSSSQSLRAN
jgi:hypothetical protein